ncbi:uncharacterized protein F5Z01DRAFT_655124 [Emericellopsis atlantica]|uniref:Fungal N-terminal domain-containing protein n=1 Tax=Emericellopsis atlantica TaxID=2614577 RepID=A0A9P8CR25_9HYPO|nr:uncharacterized protein F5Z01DRAFT_655124 [Emericellopsis atlantica]KAG9254311.1 hypothetical protein F5Z01DRAFT_655124 [Emericellopsis atlantica]
MDPLSIVAGAAGFVSLGIPISKDLMEFCDDYRGLDEDFGTLSKEAAFLKNQIQCTERQMNRCEGIDKTLQESLYSLRQRAEECQHASEKILFKMQRKNSGNWIQRQGSRLRYPLGPKRKLEDVLQQQQQFVTKINLLLAQSNINETIATRHSNEMASERLLLISDRHTEQITQILDSIGQCSRTELLQQMEKNILAAISNRSVNIAHTGGEKEMDMVTSSVTDVSTRYDSASLRPRHHKRNTRANQTSKMRLAQNSKITSKRFTGDFTVFQRAVKWDVAIKHSTNGVFQSLQIFPSLSIQGVVRWDSPAFILLRETVPQVIDWHAADIVVRRAQLRKCLQDIEGLYTAGEASPTDIIPDGNDLLSLAIRTMVDHLRRDPPPGTSDMSRIRNDLEREHELRRELISALQDFGMDINNGKHLQDESLVLGKERHPPYMKESIESHANWAAIVVALAECDFDVTYLQHEFWTNVEQLTHGCGAVSIHELMDPVIEPLYGEVSQAVIKRDEGQLSQILQLRPRLISERDSNGDTPFHIATRWPSGLKILLKSEESMGTRCFSSGPNLEGCTPLLLAAISGLTETINILLEAGVAVDERSWFFVSSEPNKELAVLFAKGLARKRLQFGELFHSACPEADNIGDACMDEGIDEALQLLRGRRIDVAPALSESYSGPPYALNRRTETPSLEFLDALHDTGFRGIDVPDEKHDTLLGRLIRYINVDSIDAVFRRDFGKMRTSCHDAHAPISWLLDHEADGLTGASFIKDKHKILHWLPVELAFLNIYEKCVSANEFQPRSEALFSSYLNKIGRSGSHGPCHCPCSRQPCAPVSIYSRIQLEQAHQVVTPRGCQPRKAWKWDTSRFEYGGVTGRALFDHRGHFPYVDSSHFLSVMQFLSDAHDKTMALEALRLATFHRLGLRHTCCLWRPKNPVSDTRLTECHLAALSAEEILEIEEEQDALTYDLEHLIDEFEEAMQEHECDFIDFLLGFWWERMERYEKEISTVQTGSAQTLRDLGIVLTIDEADEADEAA